MGWRLAPAGTRPTESFIKRFDPRFWTVDFPRPMMAAATTGDAGTLTADATFYRRDDLAGLIWEAEDRHDHPLLAYETDRDFRGCRLRFRWRSSGIKPLDAVDGPTLTNEGRAAGGAPRAGEVPLLYNSEGAP
uniref:non-contractile tail sheath protein n=1 Tax=Sphingomonas sp. TaxID=28214 RepID=UPI003B3B8707